MGSIHDGTVWLSPTVEPCKFTTGAIITEGSDLGTIHKVCPNRSCSVHHPKQPTSRNDEHWARKYDRMTQTWMASERYSDSALIGKSRIDEGRTNCPDIKPGGSARENGFFPGLRDLFLHLSDDLLRLLAIEEKSCVLGEDIRRVCKPSLIAALHGQVPPIKN